jgi:hypothetical protein
MDLILCNRVLLKSSLDKDFPCFGRAASSVQALVPWHFFEVFENMHVPRSRGQTYPILAGVPAIADAAQLCRVPLHHAG